MSLTLQKYISTVKKKIYPWEQIEPLRRIYITV